MPQIELHTPASLLDDLGLPQNFGWARQPGFFYDPALVRAPRRRLSESDRYIVFSTTHIATFEIRDDGYAGYMGISVASLFDKMRSTHYYHTLLPLGSYDMPPGSEAGSIRYRRKKLRLDFISMEGGVRIIKTDIPNFGRHRSLRGELVLTEPAMSESLVTNIPWSRDKKAFRYSRRSPWYAVEGVIQFGGTEIFFPHGRAWGILDWNRAVRPRQDIHYWASAYGHNAEHLVGFCIGYGSGDSSAGTENAFFVDGKLHKLDQVTFNIPPADWLSPWRFTSNDNRLEMIFEPHQERIERTSILLFSSTRRQVIGFFSGKVTLDDGAIFEFKNITGFAERHKTRG